MIRHKRGRVFGIINIVDFICLLALILAITGGYWYKNSRTAAVYSETDNIAFQFYMKELPQYVAENVKIGDSVKTMTGEAVLGTVMDIKIEPSRSEGVTDNGVFIISPKPGYSSLYITVQSSGRISNKGIIIGEKEYYLVRTYDIYVGQSIMSGRLYEAVKAE